MEWDSVGWRMEDGEWDGGWRMEDGGWRMEDGGWRMEDGGWRMEDGGWIVGWRVCWMGSVMEVFFRVAEK